MGQTNYTINEYGEIIREDYFFSQVKEQLHRYYLQIVKCGRYGYYLSLH